MYKALKDNKIIAISDTDNEFKFMVKDSIVEDTEHVADDYAEHNGKYLLKSEIPFDKDARVAELKAELNNTDYVVLKIAEAETAEEQAQLREHYADTIAHRKAWRTEINQLEGE